LLERRPDSLADDNDGAVWLTQAYAPQGTGSLDSLWNWYSKRGQFTAGSAIWLIMREYIP
jgi:hypothetical protein